MADKINEFPDDSTVLVWFPPPGADDNDRSTWAWLPGTILSQCAPDEWHVVVEVYELAFPDPSVPDGEAPENLLYPACFRDSSELRAVTVRRWQQAYEGYRRPTEAADK
jgi:hypothetical protein